MSSDFDNPSILSHVSVGTEDLARAAAFYDAVLATLGVVWVMEHDGAIAYGKAYPEFWVQKPFDAAPAGAANGVHFAFNASSRDAVNAFFETAMANGAASDGAPGLRPHYGAPYYGCFVRDPDGHKIEALFWDTTRAAETADGSQHA